MAGIPKTLSEWDLESIVELVLKGYTETDQFDFKEVLHASHNQENHRDGLTKAACAFANSQGGFLVFGVKDSQNAGSTQERLIGIPNSSELAKHFAEAITKAEPTVHFEHTNPPISLRESENVILVIHIPISRRGPHASRDGLFYKRTNAGNERMSYAEIRTAFSNYEERFSKVKLLYMTLVDIWIRAAQINQTGDSDSSYSLVTFDVQTIMPIFTDVYGLLAQKEELPGLIMQIKREADVINTEIQTFHQGSILPVSNVAERTSKHNSRTTKATSGLQAQIEKALDMLEDEFGFKRKQIDEEGKLGFIVDYD